MKAPGKRWQQIAIIAAVVSAIGAVLPFVLPSGSDPANANSGKTEISLERKVFAIEMPNFVNRTTPRGSIVFTPTDEMNRSGVISASLNVRSDGGDTWEHGRLHELAQLPHDKRLCEIQGASLNEDAGRYYFGLQAHCVQKVAGSSGHLQAPCSFNIEGDTMWATLGPGDQVVARLAEQGTSCN